MLACVALLAGFFCARRARAQDAAPSSADSASPAEATEQWTPAEEEAAEDGAHPTHIAKEPAVDVPAPAPAPGAGALRPAVSVDHDERGYKLRVHGRDFMVRGVVWDYYPIGTNYTYSLWRQSDAFIERVLHSQMPLLKNVGVNAIRCFDNPPPRWIRWIYEKYGIYTTVNPMLGRYGFEMDGVWIANTDYGNPSQRAYLLAELEKMVREYRGTPGILMWLLGNENNYGLHWTTFEAEALPGQASDVQRAAALYSFMSEAAQRIKRHDADRPVALVNGDLFYIDVIAKFKRGIDIFGTNQYRGPVAAPLFDEVRKKLGLPVLYTEFGADAFNAREGREDQLSQAAFLKSQWQEIYLESYGKGGVGNSLGGFIFQWADQWWKVLQTENLDVHDTTATWPHEKYYDFVDGENNMNEEWWGITAVSKPDRSGFHRVRPRAAYYLLRDAFTLDPYAADTTPAQIRAHFAALRPEAYAAPYEAATAIESRPLVYVEQLLLKLETVSTRGNRRTERGSRLQFDHTESVYVDFALRPSSKLYARVSLNAVGHVAQNHLDPLFFENRRIVRESLVTPNLEQPSEDPELERLAIYQAEVMAEHRWFDLEGYYRTGHGHWGDEGDLFGLYPSAYYGANIDVYRAEAPFGFVVSGKRQFEGAKLAFGPEVYWGANPTIIGKYRRQVGPVALTAMHQEDIVQANVRGTSGVVPEPVTRRSTLAVATDVGRLAVEVGGIFAAPRRVGQSFVWTRPASGPGYLGSGVEPFVDRVKWQDTLGGKLRLVYVGDGLSAYAQGGIRGLVADGGPDSRFTLTGWSLEESGRGNQVNGLAGLVWQRGAVQVAPHFLYQRPFIGPNKAVDDVYDPASDTYFPPLRPRNVFEDPFVVLDNRETAAAELLLTYDPTPATQYYHWDRVNREDASFAANLDFVYRHQPTSRDSRIGILADGTAVPFDGAPPARDVWDVTATWHSSALRSISLSGALYAGQNQAHGADPRLVTHYGGSLRFGLSDFLFATRVLFDDWGPYDYYRDWNLTYPVQWYGDMSWGLVPALFGVQDTRFGVRGQVRTLDRFSPGFVPSAGNPGATGAEYELTTYVQATL